MIIAVFPGQGSQTPGFLSPWLELDGARERLAAFSDQAGVDLVAAGTEWDADRIRDTAVAQPLIVAASLLSWAALNERAGASVGGVAGHSVGEIAALAASGVLGDDDALRLVGLRGRAMAEAAAAVQTGMSAVVGGDEQAVLERLDALELTPANYNAKWWELREKYQGVRAPVARSEQDFDPGAKYHIPANVPYMRYFLARILQFQFHRALCNAAGFQGPLHECSIYGNKAAGERLKALLELGASKPWPEALYAMTGERQMDASAIIEYFQPLQMWLKEQNKSQKCGW